MIYDHKYYDKKYLKKYCFYCTMTTETLSAEMHTDLEQIKSDIAFIKHILTENYGLSEQAKKSLALARDSSKSDYVSHEEIKRRFLG